MLTPFELEVLMHYFVSQSEFQRINAPAFKGAVGRLIGDDLLELDGSYKVTTRGRAYMYMLLDTPLPEHGWVDPRTNRVVQ
jgi:hypothetical protein